MYLWMCYLTDTDELQSCSDALRVAGGHRRMR